MIERMLALALLAMPAPVWAQGADTATSSPSGTGEGDAIQIGAGSTSSVTTGSSGSSEGSGGNTVAPIAPSFSITPQRESFLGPGMLAIGAPDRLRCDVIDDERAREQCERGSTDHRSMEMESAND